MKPCVSSGCAATHHPTRHANRVSTKDYSPRSCHWPGPRGHHYHPPVSGSAALSELGRLDRAAHAQSFTPPRCRAGADIVRTRCYPIDGRSHIVAVAQSATHRCRRFISALPTSELGAAETATATPPAPLPPVAAPRSCFQKQHCLNIFAIAPRVTANRTDRSHSRIWGQHIELARRETAPFTPFVPQLPPRLLSPRVPGSRN